MMLDVSEDIVTSFFVWSGVLVCCLTVAVVAMLATDGGKV